MNANKKGKAIPEKMNLLLLGSFGVGRFELTSRQNLNSLQVLEGNIQRERVHPYSRREVHKDSNTGEW